MKTLYVSKFLFRYINKEAISGILLFFATILAILIANSSYGDLYYEFWRKDLGVTFGDATISMPLIYWIDDGLMAIFFLMVGLEIKREFLYGELSSPKRAKLPIVAALGGMIVPAFLYLLFNNSGESVNGFGIPMATDIAFTLGVLMLLGKRVSIILKVFLVSLAVVDDIGAVLIIALFYTDNLNTTYLLGAGVVMLILFFLNYLKVKSLVPYILFGIVLWVFIHDSGIHATITGVLLAIMIPSKAKIKDHRFVKRATKGLMNFEKHIVKNNRVTKKQHSDLEKISHAYNSVQSPMIKLEHNLHYFSSFFIMPLFAFANAGIVFEFSNIAAYESVMIGILLGLFVGKPLGIISFVYISAYFKIVEIPSKLSFKEILGGSMLAGIGFTMSIFIAHLAFTSEAIINASKFAILFTSILSAIVGVLLLLRAYKKDES